MNLFDFSEKQYQNMRKVDKLRRYIKNKTKELNIQPQFDNTGHFYSYNGKVYPSVTGRLQILKDKSLDNWKLNRGLDFIRDNYQKMPLDDLLAQAKLAPTKEFEGAGSVGTAVHAWREEKFSRLILDYDYPISPFFSSDGKGTIYPPPVVSGIRAIQKFMKETNYLPIACEFFLADDKLNTGGTGDDFGLLNGKQTFLDLKTSNIGDKDSYFYQVAIYVLMFERLYKIRVQDAKILHVSKTDGTYKLIDIPDLRKRMKEAKQIIKVDEFLRSLKQEKKKVPIVI
jgi:hypothetical protein